MRSFDVFDTLIARRYIHHETIWQKMERDIDLPHFAHNRGSCNYGHFSDIYTEMVKRGFIPPGMKQQIMDLEVQYEQEAAIPIKENMIQVNHGDLLVSDMYLPPPDILRLVRSVGMDKQVTIHASLADKQHGIFWNAMRGHLKVEYHVGDNAHADIELARRNGFNVVHYIKSAPTEIEKELVSKGLTELAMLVRETRLRNHEPNKTRMFELANQYNLPWLFIVCEMLRRKHPNKKPVFLGRDCQLMHKIFNTYFNEASYYLPFSRKAACTNVEYAIQYIKANICPNYVLVDISSTGRTWNIIGQRHAFDIEIVHYDQRDAIPTPKNFTALNTEKSNGMIFNKKGTNLLLEVFNCADHGMLDSITMISGLPIAQFNSKHELSPEYIRVIQLPVNTALELRKFYDNLLPELSRVSDQVLEYFFDKLPRSLCDHQEEYRAGILKSYYDENITYAASLTAMKY